MKKIIMSSAAIALLLTSLQADFVFGDVFKDLKNSNESALKAPNANYVFGDVFKDLKNTNESALKAPNANYVFGDVFKDLKSDV